MILNKQINYLIN